MKYSPLESLDGISDLGYRETYRRAAYLVELFGKSAVASRVCELHKLSPLDAIRYFDSRGKFTSAQTEAVNLSYDAFEKHRIASRQYARERWNKDLAGLLKRAVEQGRQNSLGPWKIKSLNEKIAVVQRGDIVSASFFDILNAEFGRRVPASSRKEFDQEFRILKDIFMTMFNTAGVVAESNDYYGAD